MPVKAISVSLENVKTGVFISVSGLNKLLDFRTSPRDGLEAVIDSPLLLLRSSMC